MKKNKEIKEVKETIKKSNIFDPNIYKYAFCILAALFLFVSYNYYDKSQQLKQVTESYKYSLAFKLNQAEFESLNNMGVTNRTKVENISIDTLHKLILVKYE